MTGFTTRVELHDADDDDYENLHDAMEARGFTRNIEGSSGTVYKLPPAEYNYEGNVTKKQVLEKAEKAAETTGLKYSVLVTESNGRTWNHLEKA
jgi:hypothetical protein